MDSQNAIYIFMYCFYAYFLLVNPYQNYGKFAKENQGYEYL